MLADSLWFSINSGCQETNAGLFVPSLPNKREDSVVGKAFSSRHVHKYTISEFAHGIPMFPINGVVLYPATGKLLLLLGLF